MYKHIGKKGVNMKKICSLMLSIAMIATMLFLPNAVSSVAAEEVSMGNISVIKNTFDEDGWNPKADSKLLKTTKDGSNGNALQFNYVTSISATTGNAIRHYKIFYPEKVAGGGYIDYKPQANTTYKLTFRYRTRSLNSNNIFINVRSVANDTVGDILCRAVTVKKELGLSTNDDYKWDTAVAYFTTPENSLDALAVSVEWNGAADSTNGFNVAIDDLQLEFAPSSFVLADTFDDDGINMDTLNVGNDPLTYISGDVNTSKFKYTGNTSGNMNTLRTNSTVAFRAARVSTNADKAHFEIYDYNKGFDTNGKIQSFVPQKDTTYKINFDYKVARSTSQSLSINVRPVIVDGDTRTLGDIIVTAVTIPKNDENHPTPAVWKNATVNVPVAGNVSALAITIESTGNVTTYTFFDNVVVEKYNANTIINDYEQLALGSGTNADTMAKTKITGANLFHLGTKTAATPNVSRVLQFQRITGQTAIATGNYTYAEIYNPYNSGFAGFVPKANTYYKLSFDFKVQRRENETISFNVRGKTGNTLGDVIDTAATVTSNNANFAEASWGYASAVINTAGKDYETLAITVETSADGNAGLYPYFDNIVLEEIDSTGDTTLTVYHDEISGKDNDVITAKNITDFSDITFENTGIAKFVGLYLDSDYTTPATGIIYGTTKVYAKWKDISTFVNSYDIAGPTLAKLQAIGNCVTFYGKRTTELAPNTTNVIQFNNVYGQNRIQNGDITHIEIYDPNDNNIKTSDRLPSFSPLTNSVYKISFDFRIKASESSNISFNIRGKKDGQFSDVLGTAVVLNSGDPYYSSYQWNQAQVYIYTEDTKYDALALTIESDESSNANLWPYIDNIKVVGLKEYNSGVISSIAPAEGNTSGLTAIKDGKWFEVNEGDYAKVSFNLSSAPENSYAVAHIVGDNEEENVSLFDFSENSGEKTCLATFKAPISGNVVISVYKNDSAVVNEEVLLSDLNIDTFTPSVSKGDVNLDGKFNLIDLVVLKKFATMNYAISGSYLLNADLEADGIINAQDLTIICNKLLGIAVNSEDFQINAEYVFANETAGSAEGTITLASTEATDNFVDIYWGSNGQPIEGNNYIGTTEIKAGQTVNYAMDSHFAIPEGATQIIITDGLNVKAFDFAKRYSSSFVPDKIALVKDYTLNDTKANVKILYRASLSSGTYSNETYDLINEFRNELSDVLGARVELHKDTNTLNDTTNYIFVGSTNAGESTTINNNIATARDDHYGDFGIKSNGRRIYINALNDYALQFACDYFIDEYCINGNKTVPNNLDYISNSSLETITLADTDISQYRIVYPETATVLEVDAAKYLAANVLKANGKAPMSIVNDSAAVQDYEILIGHTNRTDGDTYAETADATADNSYTITVEENRTIITGGTNSAVNAGVIDFTSRILTGSLAVGTYTGNYDGRFSLTNGFKLTWSDEFNDTALSNTWQKLDLNYATQAGGQVIWDNNNATVENGALKATASKVADSNDTVGVSLDTGYNKLIKYGYFEARIKSFNETGYMNGFWGSTIGGTADYIDGKTGNYYGEFDILEMYAASGVIKPNLHNHYAGDETYSKNYLQGLSADQPYKNVSNIGTKYHNFAMKWTDDYIYFYLDGVKYYSFDCTKLSEYEVFDMVTRIRLTFSAGKYVTPTADSDEAFVDWVRVWQKNETGYVVK